MNGITGCPNALLVDLDLNTDFRNDIAPAAFVVLRLSCWLENGPASIGLNPRTPNTKRPVFWAGSSALLFSCGLLIFPRPGPWHSGRPPPVPPQPSPGRLGPPYARNSPYLEGGEDEQLSSILKHLDDLDNLAGT